MIRTLFKNNKWLKQLEVTERDGQKKIALKKTYQNLSQEEQNEIAEDYNLLSSFDPEFAQELLDYQLLTNGLAQKINSFAMLFPNSVDLQYAHRLSHDTDFAEGVSKVQAQAFELNAALRMVHDFPMPIFEFVSASMKSKESLTEENYKYKAKYYNDGGQLMINKNGKLIPASSMGSFVSNGVYFKLGRLRDFVALDKQRKISQEEYEEIKKCIK